MRDRRYLLCLTLSFLACVLVARIPLAQAVIDRTPNTQVGAIFKSTPSTLVSGDFDSLHTDAQHNLLVSGAGPGLQTPTPFGKTASNGATAVTLQAGTAAKVVIPWRYTITNTDTVGHQVNVLTSSGTVIDFTFLSPNAAYVYDGEADGFSERTLTGEGLQFSLPNQVAEGGSAVLTFAIGYTTTQ